MRKTKLYYYVLVLDKNLGLNLQNSYSANYVTDVDYKTKYCKWDSNKKPLILEKTLAQDIAQGLSLNGFNAILVNYTYEL